jgi:hypothetical protein
VGKVPLAAGAFGVWVLGCSDFSDPCVARASFMLAEGELVQDRDARFTVLLSDPLDGSTCTGALVAPNAIATAAHCLPPGAATVSLAVRRGIEAEDCLTRGPTGCEPAALHAELDLPSDFALLTSETGFSGIRARDLPLVLEQGDVAEFDALGFGVGSYRATGETGQNADGFVDAPNGTHLIRGHFAATAFNASTITARSTAEAGRTCDGDSGGPAVAAIGGYPVMLGVLTKSDYEPNEACTPPGGEQSWSRLGPQVSLIEAVLGVGTRLWFDGGSLVDFSGRAETVDGC